MVGKHLQVWKGLNERQQNYLRILYQFDQETEENERTRWHQRLPKRPASEWRWLLFDTVGSKLKISPDPALKVALRRAELIDEGTGSTFNALESRKLIECRVDFAKHEPFLATVKLTKLGRAVVRVGLGEAAPKKQPKGQLREKQWAALVAAWIAGEEGVKKDESLNYGGFSWEWTWLRLRDYYDAGKGLIKERDRFGHHSHIYEYDIAITEEGRQYYRENWKRYRELYPDVDAQLQDPTQVSNSLDTTENTQDGKERRKLNLKPFEGKWKSGQTRTIRVPIVLANEVLEYARRLDSGESLDTTDQERLRRDYAIAKSQLHETRVELEELRAQLLNHVGQAAPGEQSKVTTQSVVTSETTAINLTPQRSTDKPDTIKQLAFAEAIELLNKLIAIPSNKGRVSKESLREILRLLM